MYVLAPLLMMVACQDKPDVYVFPVDKYYYAIPNVPVTQDYVVGANYDTQTASYWKNLITGDSIAYTGTPVLGKYDVMRNPQILRQQMDYAVKAGINFFVITWNGHGSDSIFWNYENYYKAGDPKLVVKYDPGHLFGTVTDTLQKNPVKMNQMLLEIDSLNKNMMNQDYYYRDNDNKPMMVFTNFTSKGDVTSVSSMIASVRTKVNDNLWIVGELGGGWISPEFWGYQQTDRADTTKVFNALYNTNMTTSNYDRFYGYYSFMDIYFKYWQDKMQTQNVEYLPMIEPAFNNLPYTPLSNTFVLARDKNVYKNLANVAKRNVGKHRIVLINSWNNYRDGSNLEPNTQFGENYLNYTREFFKKYRLCGRRRKAKKINNHT